MSLLIGLLVGLGRLSADRESVALLACGVSPYRLLRPVLMLGTAAPLATLYVMLVSIPDANQTFRELTFEVISKRIESDIRPRVFFEDFPGWVLYARDEPDPGTPGWKDLIVTQTDDAAGHADDLPGAARPDGHQPRRAARPHGPGGRQPLFDRQGRPGRHASGSQPR